MRKDKEETFERRRMKVDRERRTFYVSTFGIVITILIFLIRIGIQREEELNEHISNMESLQLEILKNAQLMSNMIERKEEFITKVIHDQFVLENLEKSVSNGKIQNTEVKEYIIKLYFELVSLNQRIVYINSPEFGSLHLINKTEYSHHIDYFKNQTISKIKENFKPTLITTWCHVNNYVNCLKIKRNIEAC